MDTIIQKASKGNREAMNQLYESNKRPIYYVAHALLRGSETALDSGKQTATLYTRNKAVMRKLDTLVADFSNTYTLIGQDEVSKTYSCPKSYISYRKPRVVSTEQRERARQMMIE